MAAAYPGAPAEAALRTVSTAASAQKRGVRVAVVRKTPEEPAVVHFFDCADVGKTLVGYGKRAGYKWWHRPALAPGMGGAVPSGPVQAKFESTSWRIRRTIEALRADVMHVHFGTRAGVANSRPTIPFVMHWHGTDIRTTYYTPQGRPNIQWGADHAAAVVYATPDLRQHAEPVRPDAVYLPTPVDMEELPLWVPEGRPRVVFASRWDDSKNATEQLEVAAAIREATQGRVALEGLDWGHRVEEARALGITLVPKMPKAVYLKWMAGAHCVVGQSSGILGVSELQAMAMGIPMVMNLEAGYYTDAPTLQGDGPEGLAAQVLRALEDPLAVSARANARGWVERHHSPDAAVAKLAAIYRSVVPRL
ncbi:glycosyltransferase [Pseudarthrobacter sulfonivorans]|uniref:glycosyltransferase n=1 Tax=Pseudarthrobacter sulfonivorans TaxID=121292 RepID=UPI00286D33C1|nr:glycosyltransferase [Pseudarthrobacter sulfonivorans]